jgi:hypothetical protein
MKEGADIAFMENLATCDLGKPIPAADFIKMAEEEVKPFRSRFGALFLDHLDDPGPEHEWLIEQILSVGDKSVCGGAWQSGKSFLAIHMGLILAHGMEFFGAAVKPGLVIYQAGEGSRGCKKRIRAWRNYHGVRFTRETPFVLLQNRVDLYSKEGDTKALIAEIRAIQGQFDCPLRLVVFDTLATASVGAEENSAKDIGIVMDHIAQINAELGCHVMLVHHMSAGGDKLRGSTAIPANVDTTISVVNDPSTGIRTCKIGKQRDDEAGAVSWQFELKRIELDGKPDSKGRPPSSCVVLPVGEKEAVRLSEERKGFALKPATEEPFMKAYFDAERRYGQPVPPGFDIDSRIRSIVEWTTVKRVVFERTPDDEIEPEPPPDETPEALLKRTSEREKKRRYRAGLKIKSAREGLERFGVIGFGQHETIWYCWWTGKPLRGFPLTQPRQEREAPFAEGLGEEEIPF